VGATREGGIAHNEAHTLSAGGNGDDAGPDCGSSVGPDYPDGSSLNENNCFGAGSSNFVAGQGGFPGSNVDRVLFGGKETFNGPTTSDFVKQQGGTTLAEFQPGTGFLSCTGPGQGTSHPAL
jgi:hypothetical protein